MADSSDVESAIVGVIVSALYPSGTGQPSIVGPIINVARGWPTEADIRNAVGAGTQIIRVYAINGMSRNDMRYFTTWQYAAPAATTLVATLTGSQITFSGTVTAGEIVGVLSAGVGYTYVVQANDTLTTIATGVAAAVPGASSTGAVVTLPATGGNPGSDVATGASAWQEVGRQKQFFTIAGWATTPALRDAIFSALMAAIATSYRLTMPDGTTATQFDLQTSGPNDVPSRADEWARTLRVGWDFAIANTVNAPPMAVGVLVAHAPVTDVAINTTYSV